MERRTALCRETPVNLVRPGFGLDILLVRGRLSDDVVSQLGTEERLDRE